ncbi:hypothetical protein VTH8203_00853 [Vibrio thalassae]|uniref:Uncharacterized protein n=1 Tax=Vibrio thalassae TaxID=1243014 RepID=A0A240EEZ0_9VIBR|nr:DUF1525 domain-containing protein [Vibrio thalassae]SNX47252.1 hypothetical protein VTH8203_00853 [Vibrio thalassae]
MRKLVLLFWLLIPIPLHSAPMLSWPDKIILLTTTDNKASIGEEKRAAKGAAFDYYFVDHSKKILSGFEQAFPKKLIKEPEEVRNQYIAKHFAPQLKAYTPEIMRSEMGIGLVKLFQIKRVPAVIINDKYITYGLSVEQSVNRYIKTRQRN